MQIKLVIYYKNYCLKVDLSGYIKTLRNFNIDNKRIPNLKNF